MAFTAPTTRATDFLVTAAVWNTEHVDNMNTAWPHLVVRRTSNQSVTSSTALVNDDTLQLTVGANEVWLFEFVLRYDGLGAADIRISFAIPAGATVDAASLAPSDAAGAYQDAQWISMATSDATVFTFACSGANQNRINPIKGLYVGAGTAGTFILRWAQGTSNATATRMLTNSTLWAVKLA